jgi:uncharacterized protein YkwD
MTPALSALRSQWRIVAPVVCLLLSLLPASVRAEENSDSASQLNAEAQAIAHGVNQRRGEAGLPALALHPLLTLAAQNHVNDILHGGAYGHVGSDGSNVRQRVQRVGYSSGGYASENWVNATSPDNAMNWWMNDWIHRVNILNQRWREFGVGVGTTASGRQIYVTVFTAGEGAGGEVAPPVVAVAAAVQPAPGGGASYTIQSGDTLIGIAARYGVDWTSIAEENRLREETLLQIGQVIRIPGVATGGNQNSSSSTQAANATQYAGGASGSYTVKPGDTLLGIALQHGLTWQALGSANGLGEFDLLQIGQQLTIPGAATPSASDGPASPPASEPVYYIIQEGDTVFSVAIRNNLDWQALLALNGLSESSLLQIGQQIRLR